MMTEIDLTIMSVLLLIWTVPIIQMIQRGRRTKKNIKAREEWLLNYREDIMATTNPKIIPAVNSLVRNPLYY